MDYIVTVWFKPYKRYVVKDVANEEEAWEAFTQDDFDFSSMLLDDGESRKWHLEAFNRDHVEIQPDENMNLARGYGVPVDND